MLRTAVKIAKPVKVVLNTSDRRSHQWGQIRCAVSGRVLHTGQVPYIRALARKRYNTQVVS